MTREELDGDPADVAVRLLGATLRCGGVAVRLVEVEAYGGADDAASHAYRGPRVANRTMFGPPGHLYVYLSYGIHDCANVVCGPQGAAAAVLLRGGEVVRGLRAVESAKGPARSERASSTARASSARGWGSAAPWTARTCSTPPGAVRLEAGVAGSTASVVVAGPRVGLTKEIDRPWRFRLVRR